MIPEPTAPVAQGPHGLSSQAIAEMDRSVDSIQSSIPTLPAQAPAAPGTVARAINDYADRHRTLWQSGASTLRESLNAYAQTPSQSNLNAVASDADSFERYHQLLSNLLRGVTEAAASTPLSAELRQQVTSANDAITQARSPIEGIVKRINAAKKVAQQQSSVSVAR